MDISNQDDIIDSRDVIARIEEIQEEMNPDNDPDLNTNITNNDWQNLSDELAVLQDLAEEGSASPDWEYGETLIRDSYFKTYAQDLAEDIGAVNTDSTWPNNCIDWEEAASELQIDYSCIEYDGVDYWIRS